MDWVKSGVEECCFKFFDQTFQCRVREDGIEGNWAVVYGVGLVNGKPIYEKKMRYDLGGDYKEHFKKYFLLTFKMYLENKLNEAMK